MNRERELLLALLNDIQDSVCRPDGKWGYQVHDIVARTINQLVVEGLLEDENGCLHAWNSWDACSKCSLEKSGVLK